jgi:o-succinylbenzoate---CoA ligase
MLIFNQFKNSFFKDLYHLENDIFCIFDSKKYSEEVISSLCFEARQHVTHGFLFQTSGTTSNKKFVLHDFNAVMTSSESVNEWVHSNHEDLFLAPISIHHMGGFSVLARSFFAKAKQPTILTKWSLNDFIKIIESEHTSVTSLVPSQVYEIVHNQIKSPKSLRTIFVGGAALDLDLYRGALKLGWPLFKTFGSSEACSQIFTENKLLPHWKIKIEDDNRLQIKGLSLYKGYLILKDGHVKFAETPRTEGGYFITEDLVEVQDNQLIGFKGRINDFVKINSSLVQLAVLRKDFYKFCMQQGLDAEKLVLTVKDDSKNGLHLVVYTELSLKGLDIKLELWNQNKTAAEIIRGIYSIKKIPKTELGKVKYSELK